MASSAPITFGGLASGLDTNSIIDKLVSIERQPITDLQTTIQNEQSQKTLVGDLITKIGTLSTAVTALNTQAAVEGRAATVASGAPFTADVTGGAPTGSYNIQVTALAQAQRTYSTAFADPNATGVLSAGTLTIGMGGKTATISVDGTDSLNSVATKLDGAGLGLTAGVIYDGTKYRMVVNGADSGAANAITFSDPSGTGLGLDVAANTVVSAHDAQLTVDGLAITSSTNTVNNSIPGVTLHLTGTAATASSLDVTQDQSQLKTALGSIVTAYNAIMTVVNKQFPTDASNPPGPGTLTGDSTIRQLQSTMLNLPTQPGGPTGNTYTSLVDLGISVDRYGTMSIDQNRLQTVLDANPTAVTNLLVGTDGKNGLMKQISDTLSTYTDFVSGFLPTKQKSIDDLIKSQNDEIARMDTAATAYETNLRQQFSDMEQLISSFQSQTSSLTALTGGVGSSGSSSSSKSSGG